VRLGRRNYQIGKAALVSREIKIPIEILDVAYATVGDLDEVTAVSEGYGSIDDLKKELTHFYPSIGEDSEITIVRFRVI
jgi:hypothetical protein